MDIARKFKSHTVCIRRHEFRTDFSVLITSLQSQVSANLWTFRKMDLLPDFQTNAKNVPWTWAVHFTNQISCSQSVTSRHLSNDAKEADILDRCGLPLNGG